MKDIRLIDTRRYFNLKKEKIKPKDRRLLMMVNHNEVLFNENMLHQNRILVIALFALFFAGLSIILNLEIISNLIKTFFIIFLIILSLWLFIILSKATKRIKIQNTNIKTNYGELFKYHLNYAKK